MKSNNFTMRSSYDVPSGKSADYYRDEMNRILKLLIFSYKKLVKEEKFDLCEHENFLRNLLVRKYLRKYKSCCGLSYLIFNVDVGTINNTYHTHGSIDIRVSNPKKLLGYESIYFSFECKRLDGYLPKSRKYINKGINRYIIGRYARKVPLGGMIGFVQGFKKGANVELLVNDIRAILKKHKKIKTLKNLTLYTVKKDFKYSYESKHERGKQLPDITLYHLFFDFTESKNL